MSRNIVTKMEGKVLVIRIDLDVDTVPSASGKSDIIASTGGNMRLENPVTGQPMFLGVNAYEYKKEVKEVKDVRRDKR